MILNKLFTGRKILPAVLFFLLFFNFLPAQECGPSCPICSGNTDSQLLQPNSFFLNTMFIPGGEEENTVLNLRYGLFKWMDIGIGYGLKEKKWIWNSRIQIKKENKENWSPGIFLGTGSVRTGKSDQSVYFYLNKSWEILDIFTLRLSAGASLLFPDLDKVYGIASFSLGISKKYSIFVNYDGINFHEGISWIPLDWLTFSAYLIESKDLAIAVGFKWGF